MSKNERKFPVFLLVLLILILAIGTVAGFYFLKKTEKESTESVEEEEAEQVFAVNTTIAVEGQIRDFLYVNGDIIAKESVDVYPDAAGKLTDIRVKVGETVYKGKIIAYVDPSRPGMNFANSPIKSPISGTVTSFPGTIGSTVSQQAPIATIGDLSNLEVRTYISERKISHIENGMKAELTFGAFPGEFFDAVITELNPVIDPSSRTMEIKLDLLESDTKIKSGMFAKIKITTSIKDNIVKIPSDCITERFGEKFVYVITDENRTEKRVITEGINVNDVSEILTGIKTGEKIVIQGQSLLENDVKVKIMKEVTPISQRNQEEADR